MATTHTHVPVMSGEILDALAAPLGRPQALAVDATLGLGGHTAALLERYPGLRLIGIDRDPQALAAARERLAPYASRVEFHEATYDQLGSILAGRRPAAVLFDLGLSSLQIDSPERGFAYAADAPLSMRMDGDDTRLTAADVVGTYTADELRRIFRTYGDEPHAARIARAIIEARERAPLTTSAQLVAVVVAAVPAGGRTGHPAKRVFQALRVEVNDERGSLERALPQARDALALGGRLAVLSYHSGEDRFVKRLFADAATDQVPPGLAVVPAQLEARFRLVGRGALQPGSDEIARNPRSQSARLRVIERVKEA
ncbi:MAG: 16S rRNA (cytosine(1402)-N(4))-methyltransferase RsmH [Propionibacteriaceae bacterium]|jgi:16S rRNA (cytosine1402-N4)-methyltransferase|nr:16S rRNA (cytosine(1402)-N(4))-methyltransferase RsmH [Propionibacteriaceae bacterium]